jgi:hypothetical protein
LNVVFGFKAPQYEDNEIHSNNLRNLKYITILKNEKINCSAHGKKEHEIFILKIAPINPRHNYKLLSGG